jgi:CRP-like cAMP-binding protein
MSTALAQHIQHIFPLSPSAEALLLEHAQLLTLKRRAFFLQEGKICRHISFVETGSLRAYYVTNDKEINTGFYLENCFTTSLKSLRNGTPAEQYIQAMETSRLWLFAKEDLLQLYKQCAELESFGRNLLEALVIEQEEQAQLFRLYTPEERYLYMEKHHPALLQRISQSQLASYLGIARETISRIRKRR